MSSVAINIRRGDTLDLRLEFFSDTDETTPVDFTGSTLSLADSTFVEDPTFTTVDESGGVLSLAMTPEQTSALVARRVYQLEIRQVQPGGAVRTYGPLVFVAST
jgi:hypothetical protein